MSFFNRLVIVFGGCIMVMGSAHAANSVTSIALTPCPLNDSFYCLTVGGGAFKQSVEAIFDTGGNVFIIPEDCLKKGSYQEVPGQPTNVYDPWGNPAKVVQGEVSLINGDQVVATLKDFQFMAGTTGTCKTGYKNFGAGFDFYTYFPNSQQLKSSSKKQPRVSKRFSYLEPMVIPQTSAKAKQRNLSSLRDGEWDSCLGSFFIFHTLENGGSSQAYGFQTTYIDSALHLTVGPLNNATANAGWQITQFSAQPPTKCGGKDNVVEYLSEFDKGWTGPTVNNFSFSIGGVPTYSFTAGSKGAIQNSPRIMMVDSGGGMVIISDNSQGSLASSFKNASKAVDCPEVDWLTGCACINAGQLVNVSNIMNSNFFYSYMTTDFSSDESKAVAICPAWQQGSSNPYISPNGFNSGHQLFQQADVLFDFKSGRLMLKVNSTQPQSSAIKLKSERFPK